MTLAEPLLTAPIECRRAAAPSAVTFVGRTKGGARAHLTLAALAPADLPAVLEKGSVERLDERRYRIGVPGREWIIEASRSFMHEDVSTAFYAALPPRRVPLGKRLLWRVVLSAAASRAGRWWSAR